MALNVGGSQSNKCVLVIITCHDYLWFYSNCWWIVFFREYLYALKHDSILTYIHIHIYIYIPFHSNSMKKTWLLLLSVAMTMKKKNPLLFHVYYMTWKCDDDDVKMKWEKNYVIYSKYSKSPSLACLLFVNL